MTRPASLWQWVVGILTAAGLAAGCCLCRPSPAAVDPLARQQIDRMCAVLAELSRYEVTVQSLTDEPLEGGPLVEVGRTMQAQVQQPDRMSLRVERDSGERWAAWIDQGTLTLLDETTGRVAVTNLPPRLGDAIEALAEQHGLHLPLADIVSGLRRADLLARVEAGSYLGIEPVNGTPCHHLLFRQPVADWQAWISTNEPALLQRIVLVYKEDPGQPGYQATFTAWNPSPRFTPQTWLPTMPTGIVNVAISELVEQE